MSRVACSNGHALTGNGQLHMPEPQLQLLRSALWQHLYLPGWEGGLQREVCPPTSKNPVEGGEKRESNRTSAMLSRKCQGPLL